MWMGVAMAPSLLPPLLARTTRRTLLLATLPTSQDYFCSSNNLLLEHVRRDGAVLLHMALVILRVRDFWKVADHDRLDAAVDAVSGESKFELGLIRLRKRFWIPLVKHGGVVVESEQSFAHTFGLAQFEALTRLELHAQCVQLVRSVAQRAFRMMKRQRLPRGRSTLVRHGLFQRVTTQSLLLVQLLHLVGAFALQGAELDTAKKLW